MTSNQNVTEVHVKGNLNAETDMHRGKTETQGGVGHLQGKGTKAHLQNAGRKEVLSYRSGGNVASDFWPPGT